MWRLMSFAAGMLAFSLVACSGTSPGARSTSSAARIGSESSQSAQPETANYARAQPVTPVPGGAAGAISGKLAYPSDFLPAQAVYAITTDGARFYRVETVSGQSHYTLVGVGPGDYFVLATTRWPPAYTAASGP